MFAQPSFKLVILRVAHACVDLAAAIREAMCISLVMPQLNLSTSPAAVRVVVALEVFPRDPHASFFGVCLLSGALGSSMSSLSRCAATTYTWGERFDVCVIGPGGLL